MILCHNEWCDYYQEFKTDHEYAKKTRNLTRHKKNCDANYRQKKVYKKGKSAWGSSYVTPTGKFNRFVTTDKNGLFQSAYQLERVSNKSAATLTPRSTLPVPTEVPIYPYSFLPCQ